MIITGNVLGGSWVDSIITESIEELSRLGYKALEIIPPDQEDIEDAKGVVSIIVSCDVDFTVVINRLVQSREGHGKLHYLNNKGLIKFNDRLQLTEVMLGGVKYPELFDNIVQDFKRKVIIELMGAGERIYEKFRATWAQRGVSYAYS